jgi:hypothetical protein
MTRAHDNPEMGASGVEAADRADESDQVHRDSVGRRSCRGFTILDGMILIVGTALSFVQLRLLRGDIAYNQVRLQPPVASNRLTTGFAVLFFVGALNSLVFMLTPTYTIVRLRWPRPTSRDLFWQPGMLTSLIVLFYHSILLFCVLFSYVIHTVLYVSLDPWFGHRPRLLYLPCCLVACGWLVAKLAGRFRPEPGWIEWLGRALGLGWMVGGILLFVIIRWL